MKKIEFNGKEYTIGDTEISDDPVIVWDTMSGANAVIVYFTDEDEDIHVTELHEVKS